jgi:hypothetical protein
MLRLPLLLPLFLILTACADARGLTREQLEKMLCEKAQFFDVSLHSTGENLFSGTAKDGMGQEYDITVEVSRSRISYKAEGRNKKLTREQLEQSSAKLLSLSKIVLEEKSPDRFEGMGISADGQKLQLEVELKGEGYSVNWKDKDRQPRNIQILSVTGLSSKAGSFPP